MKIGFGAPVAGSWATPHNLVRIARQAESLGYHELWTYQRLLVPADASWGEPYRSVQDPIVTLAYLAGHTTRIRLGVAVVNLSFYSPALLAKQTATLDIVAGGRFDLGLGIGWAKEEFTAAGVSMTGRGRRADEFITAMRALWIRDVVTHEGEFYRIPPARMDPKPVQRPHPPILLGAKSEPALRRAGRLADGWISSSNEDLTKSDELIAIVKAAAAEAGRDPEALRFVCRGAVQVRKVRQGRPLTGTLDDIRADIAWLESQGFTELFVDLNFDPEIGSPDADASASMRRAEEILEALRGAG